MERTESLAAAHAVAWSRLEEAAAAGAPAPELERLTRVVTAARLDWARAAAAEVRSSQQAAGPVRA